MYVSVCHSVVVCFYFFFSVCTASGCISQCKHILRSKLAVVFAQNEVISDPQIIQWKTLGIEFLDERSGQCVGVSVPSDTCLSTP